MDTSRNTASPVMAKKTVRKSHRHDRYCFECHQGGDLVGCEACPRAYHVRCLGSMLFSDNDWLCLECQTRLSALDRTSHSVDEYQMLFRHALQQMRSRLQAKNMLRSILVASQPETPHSIIYPMDLNTVVKHVNEKKYPSAQAFLADVKWIVHNVSICHGAQDMLTCTARELLDIVSHEITEFQLCSQCYRRSIQSHASDWFAQSCQPPHALCWAKMKTYQPWPGKIFRVVNDLVDVRFFGQHDRAWIPIKQCFVLSKEYPSSEKKKMTRQFELSLTELQTHIEQLRQRYGAFTYAPLRTAISKTKPFRFVPIIDGSILPTYMSESESSARRQIDSSPETRTSGKRQSDSSERDLSSKRGRFSSIDIDDDLPQTTGTLTNRRDPSLSVVHENENLNVFDIFTREGELDRPTTSTRRRSSPSNDPLRIQALLKKYLDRPSRENRTSPSNLFTCSSADQSLSITLPSIPIRALSISPPSPVIFERISLAVDENEQTQESLLPAIKIEPIEYDTQWEIDFIRHSSTGIGTHPDPDLRRSARSPTLTRASTRQSTSRSISPENIWLSALSVESPRQQSASDSSASLLMTIPTSPPAPVLSPIADPSFTQIPEHSSQPPLDNDAQAIIDEVHHEFQDLLVEFTEQIRSCFERNRLKHVQNLEETRRSYLLSVDDLHTVTNKQVEAMQHTLESQYWTRLADMRHRHGSTLERP